MTDLKFTCSPNHSRYCEPKERSGLSKAMTSSFHKLLRSVISGKDPCEYSMETVAAAIAVSQGGNSSGLLNGVVRNLWPTLNAAVSKTVKESVEPIFQTLPGPLKSLKFVQLDLGNVPFHIENVIVHDKEADRLQFDLDIVWISNCNVELNAVVLGNFGVSELKLRGRLSVIFSPIIDVLPVVSAVQVCFINLPEVDIDFRGIANLADFGLIKEQIRGVINDVIRGLMVLPNRMYFKVDATSSFLNTYKPPIGVVRLSNLKGSGFKGRGGLLGDGHDVYLNIGLGGVTARTLTKDNSSNPEWGEMFDFLSYDFDQVISVHAWDQDSVGGDDDLGRCQISVREMLLLGKKATMELHHGSHKGGMISLNCELCPLSMSDYMSFETNASKDSQKDRIVGVVTMIVVGIRDLKLEKAEAKPWVRVVYGENEFKTGKVEDAPGVDCLNPMFDAAFCVTLKAGSLHQAPVEFILMNGEDTILGATIVKYDNLVAARTMTEVREIGGKGTKIEFRVSLYGVVQPTSSPISMLAGSTSAQATTSSVTSENALGTVRLTVVRGWGFQVERSGRLIKRKDVPDVYCSLTFGSSPNLWKTKTVHDSVTPEWNESRDYLMSGHEQTICIKAFDEDTGRDKDDELGTARVAVGKLLLAGGTMDLEFCKGGSPTGLFVSIRCNVLDQA